jgi:hypothetical protein
MAQEESAATPSAGAEPVVLPSQPKGERFTGDTPNTVLFIQRSKNQNVVCYEASPDRQAALEDPKKAMVGYWMDIDPEYVAKARKKGKKDDRDELSALEHKFAYGYDCAQRKEISSDLPEELPNLTQEGLRVKFVAIPKRDMELRWRLDDGTPVIITVLRPEGQEPKICVLERVYVQSTEPKGFFSLPSVEYVELFGRTDLGEELAERVKN